MFPATPYLEAMNNCLKMGGRLATAADGTEMTQIVGMGEERLAGRVAG